MDADIEKMLDAFMREDDAKEKDGEAWLDHIKKIVEGAIDYIGSQTDDVVDDAMVCAILDRSARHHILAKYGKENYDLLKEKLLDKVDEQYDEFDSKI